MRHFDWDNIQEASGFDDPKPGAYIAVITRVEDVEEKEYLLIEWDFAEGTYKGFNQDTFDRASFWPTKLIRSYKPKALGFFKAFKTALEDSNPGYHFNEADLRALVGKKFGVVLGEEEYRKKDYSTGKRLYVAQARSLQAIQKGDFTIPDLKRLSDAPQSAPPSSWSGAWGAPAGGAIPYAELSKDEGELPF